MIFILIFDVSSIFLKTLFRLDFFFRKFRSFFRRESISHFLVRMLADFSEIFLAKFTRLPATDGLRNQISCNSHF